MISTHILDTSLGMPAANVAISLDIKDANGNWKQVDQGTTNNDGRVAFNCPSELGIYRLNFSIEDYFLKQKTEFFFLNNSIIFQVKSTDRKYHVPILLNPYGYTTYRGS